MAEVLALVGLGFGDEGKGSICEFLTREHNARLVVRHNGGAQAAHNCVLKDGRHHTFAQFGSGTLTGAATFLSRFMLVNPITFLKEAQALQAMGLRPRVYVDRDALVTTPFHVSANRIREMVRTGRHGSCGMGIGETMSDFLDNQESFYVGQVEDDPIAIRAKLGRILDRKRDEVLKLTDGHAIDEALGRELSIFTNTKMIGRVMAYYADFAKQVTIVDRSFLDEVLEEPGTVIFEGAQGVLLDQDFGFQPYTTWTDCTFGNVDKLLENFRGDVTRLGILRAYHTRHGNGPFVTEDKHYDACSAHDHNTLGEWQGVFRSGPFDLVMAKYALAVVDGIDGLVMTNLDRLAHAPKDLRICTSYYNTADGEDQSEIPVWRPVNLEHQAQMAIGLMQDVVPRFETVDERGELYAFSIAERLQVPLAFVSFGPCAEDKRVADKILAHAV